MIPTFDKVTTKGLTMHRQTASYTYVEGERALLIRCIPPLSYAPGDVRVHHSSNH